MRQAPVPLESTVVWLVVEEHYSMVSNQDPACQLARSQVEIRVTVSTSKRVPLID